MAAADLVISGCAIATVDPAGQEYASGHIAVTGDRITAIGAGPPPDGLALSRQVEGSGCLATPGLVNTHDHLYQWASRGLAQDATLFEWLTTLYPLWAHIDEGIVSAAALAGLVALARSGCTMSTDHHYVFPRGAGDLLAAEIAAAARVGIRFHPCRGAMDLGRSSGGLPPDELVEDVDAALAAIDAAIGRWHDPSPTAMLRIAVAPCSPFSVSARLMREAAALARSHGVRLHTHLAETLDEDAYCRDTFGCGPVEYADKLGWLGDDVWLAHGVHIGAAGVGRLAATGTGVAHCPSSNARLGSGIAPVRPLLDAGAPVGLGVDGAASNESASLAAELRQALYAARLGGGPHALSARDALALATIGGARCLGRGDELGSLEVGKLADIALWRVDGFGSADVEDPVAALVFGPPLPLQALLVGGRPVLADGEVPGCPPEQVSRDLVAAARRLARRRDLAAR
jgi:cytosine/adenosine deaminase-related metal-dependent hydrolase